jgi:chemotaxis protein methyltransferase CheR
MSFPSIKNHMAQRCGLRFDNPFGEEKLQIAVADRMQQTGQITVPGYFNQIISDKEEFQCLVNLLTINETYFFREPEQLHFVVDHLIPKLLSRAEGKQSVRILSAGCSSGEEPYSLAMALWERYGENMRQWCRITGIDIDSTVLNNARKGIYREFSFRRTPAKIRSQFFEQRGYEWQINSDIRSLVKFQELNLLFEKNRPDIEPLDIIFLRNVSIYFDEPTRRRIQKNMRSLLKENGVLIVGCTETLANDLGIFNLAQKNGLFYFRNTETEITKPRHVSLKQKTPEKKITMQTEPPKLLAGVLPVLTLPQSWPEQAPTSICLDELRKRVEEQQYDAILPQLEALLKSDSQHQEALLLKAQILMNQKKYTLAESIVSSVLQTDPWNIDGLVLLGLIAKWNQQADEALNHFKQATYSEPNCWPAHYYLAGLYRKGGSHAQASREYRTTLKLMTNNCETTGLKSIALGLPITKIRHLCEYQLGQLEDQEAVREWEP